MDPLGKITGSLQVYAIVAGTIVDFVGTPFKGNLLKVIPLHNESEVYDGIAGVGSTYTSKVKALPVQPAFNPDFGVIE